MSEPNWVVLHDMDHQVSSRCPFCIKERADAASPEDLERVWGEWKADNTGLTTEQFEAAMSYRTALVRALGDSVERAASSDADAMRRVAMMLLGVKHVETLTGCQCYVHAEARRVLGGLRLAPVGEERAP